MLDLWMRSRAARAPDSRIALVGITEWDIGVHRKARARTGAGGCTCEAIPRCDIGRAIARIKGAGAKVVALDLMLSQPCPAQKGTTDAHDDVLVKALTSPGETVIVAKADPSPDCLRFTDPPTKFLGDPENPDDSDPIVASPVVYNPHGVIRGVRLVQEHTPSQLEQIPFGPVRLVGRQYPPLSVAAYNAYQGRPCEVPEVIGHDRVECAGLSVPVWASESIYLFEPIMPEAPELHKHAMLINWAGPTGAFPMYWLYEVMKQSEEALTRRFKDKVVFIGSLADRKHVPVHRPPQKADWPLVDQSSERSMSGLEIHANALHTLLQGGFVRPVSIPAAWTLVFACCLLTTFAFTALRIWRAVGVAVTEVAILVALAYVLAQRDQWLYTAIPVTAIVLTGLVTAMWGYAAAWQRASSLATAAEARDAATETLVHDLKQPLATISALSSALRAQHQHGADGASASPELLQLIQQQVEMALGDIDELLATSPDREIPLDLQEFDIAALATDLAVTQSMKSSVHQVEVRAPEGGCAVVGDPQYLGRALNNLMDNAIKYWPEGGTVIVEAAPEDDEVVVRVIDRGLGMSREQQSRIFARFERALPEGVEIPGTGMGLYSVRRIVEAHAGTIEVESELGMGSTFTLRIPYQPTPEAVS